MTTTAETIANALNNDGQRFAAADGTSLTNLCAAANARKITRGIDTKWVFGDGSAIVESGGAAWDLALAPTAADCFCWECQDGEHGDHCLTRSNRSAESFAAALIANDEVPCIMVKRSNTGTYDVPGSAECVETVEQLDGAGVTLTKLDDLVGWGIWTEVAEATNEDGETSLYVVAR